MTNKRLRGGDCQSSLPADEYTSMSIRGFYSGGDCWYSRWAESNQPMGTFRVAPGKVADLGRIVLYPSVEGDRFANLLARIPESEAPSFFDDNDAYAIVKFSNSTAVDGIEKTYFG